MFGFLKDKLKSWLGKSKEKVEEKAEKTVVAEAKKEKPIKEKKERTKKQPKSKEQIKEERETTDKVIKDIEKEKLEIKTPEQALEHEEKEAKLDKIQEEIKEETKPEPEKKPSFFSKFKKFFSYSITKDNFDEIFSDLETLLLESNVALEVVEKIKSDLEKDLIGKEVKKDEIEKIITNSLKNAINNILINPEDIIEKIKEHKKQNNEPFKILFFGINGAGKTTSIAKFADLCLKNKLSVVLAAADTFRAASIEQLQVHADKLGVKMIKQNYNSDPSAVAFDAIKYAKTNKIDVVLIDTAGRMHTKENLLKEMEKICRVTKPNLKVFVAEALAGNDATLQAQAFNDMIGIDGSILSKVDVDTKGGTIISISFITQKPIFYLGTGQNYSDLELFNKEKFIERLGL